MEPVQIVRRFNNLRNIRKGSIEDTWDLIERYIMPMRGGRFFEPQDTEEEITFRRPNVFDNTATIGLDLLSANIDSSLTSFNYRWFNLQLRDKQLMKLHPIKVWLQDVSDIMFYALYDSNFSTEVQESYLDLCAMGNTVLAQDEMEGGKLNFASVPVREIFFEEDATGKLRNMYRDLQWTASRIVDKFGVANCPTEVVKDYQAGNLNKHTVIFCVYKRDLPDSNPYTPKPDNKRPYGYTYINETGTHTYQSGGYYEMPAYITRWRKTSGSVWGYGPGNVAIPSVLTANKIVELNIEQAELDLDPPLVTTPRGLIGDFNYAPRAINLTRNMNELAAFQRQSRMDTSQLVLEELRQQIRAVFMTDQLQLKDSPQMSASEANIRFELMNRLLGPTAGMIQNDLLEPMLRRTFNQLMRSGQLPEPPEELAEGVVDIEYTGPLSKAQRMDTVMATERFLTTTASMAEIFPDLRHLPNVEEIGRDLAQALGVPADNLNSPLVFKQAIEEEKQMAQDMQKAQMAESVSKSMKNVSEVQQ
jgi:hypothetical protein